MNVAETEKWLEHLMERKAEEIALMVTERLEAKLRAREGDRLRLSLDDDTPISLLPLSTRLLRALDRAGLVTLGELKAISADDLRRWRNIGRFSLEQLQRFLGFAGRSLKPGGSSAGAEVSRGKASKHPY